MKRVTYIYEQSYKDGTIKRNNNNNNKFFFYRGLHS